MKTMDPGYPLAPHYLHMGDDGAVLLLAHTGQTYSIDSSASLSGELPDTTACSQFDKQTRAGEDMQALQHWPPPWPR